MDEGLKATIIKLATDHQNTNCTKVGYRACVSVGSDYFVKFGNRRELDPEITTQEFIYHHAESDPESPRVAKILGHFQEGPTVYMVMEYIVLVGPADFDRKAKALEWLSKVPPAPGHVLGPVGGGPMWHRVFQDYQAPLDFEDINAVHLYFKRARGMLSRTGQKLSGLVNMRNDRVLFSQSDLSDGNFGVDRDGRTVVMDFESIGLLPETLVAYTLASEEGFRPLISALGLRGEARSGSLPPIRACLWMAADPTLGLGNDGKAKAGTATARRRPRQAVVPPPQSGGS